MKLIWTDPSIYRIAGERIEILTIVHGSRDLTLRRTAP